MGLNYNAKKFYACRTKNVFEIVSERLFKIVFLCKVKERFENGLK